MSQLRRGVLGLAVAVVVGALGGGRRADACGGWAMHDLERKLLVIWQPTSAEIHADGPNGKLLVRMFTEDDGGVVTLLDSDGHPLVRGHAGNGPFAIDVEPTGKEVDETHQTFYWFSVRVTRDDRAVITADSAMGLCTSHGPPSTQLRDRERREIEARIRAYLAWRDSGK